jgi:hypothetical protein
MTRLPRTRVLVALVLVALTLAVVLSALVARAAFTSDMRCFWTGARFVAEGLDPYDSALWTPAVSGTGIDAFGSVREAPCPGRYGYPITTAVITLPLALMPLEVAAIVWHALLLVGVVLGVVLLARAAQLPRGGTLLLAVVVLYCEPFWQNVMSAQYGGIELLGAGLLSIANGGASLAAAVVVATLKPHVLPLAVIERLRRARARDIVAVAAILAVLLGISLMLRPSWPTEWLSELTGSRRSMSGSAATIWGLVTLVAGREVPAVSIAVSAAAALAFLLPLRGVPTDAFDRLAIAVVVWLLFVPYLLTGDQIVLAVAWCAIVRRSLSSPGLFLALVAAVDVASWSLYSIRIQEGIVMNTFVIPITAALLVFALRRHRSVAAT